MDRQKSSATVVSAGTGYVDKMAAEMASIYGGEAELAGKVRPSNRKPGQTIEDAVDPPSVSAAE